MDSPYNLQMQQIQLQIQQQLMAMNGVNFPAMMHMSPMNRSHDFSEAIVVDVSDDEDDEEQRTLFVANLDDRVTEEILHEAFLQAGPIEKTRIPKDNTGRQRTFGFVTYAKRCSAPYALRLMQGLTFFRKSLTIKYKGKLLSPGSRSSPIPKSRYSYDNSSLRGGNYSSYENQRMDKMSPSGSSRHQERNSKHGSNQTRHSNSGPYQRRDSPSNYDKWRNNNKGNSRYSDNRSGKYRR